MKLSALVAVLPAVLAAPATKRAEPAPILTPRDVNQLIDGKYIVKFKDTVSIAAVDETVSALSQKADYVYGDALRGFAGSLNSDDLDSLRDHPDVSRLAQPRPMERALTANALAGRVH